MEDIASFRIPAYCQLPLTDYDMKKMRQLAEKAWIRDSVSWRTQLDLMAARGVKVEIQSLSAENCRFLCEEYLPRKIEPLLPTICPLPPKS